MDEDRRINEKRRRKQIWLAIGAIVLIVLLLGWLFVAFLLGDTDVAAFIAPAIS